jgi:hypothetical protein
LDTDDGQLQEHGERLGTGTRIVFSIALACCVLVPAELLLQLHYYLSVGEFLMNRGVPGYFEQDDVRCYRLRANLNEIHNTNEFETVVYTNDRGFRSGANQRTVAYDKPADVYRILFLGPSMTFGWGVDFEDIYPSLIAEGLIVPGKRIEFINAGTPAQPLGAQACWLRAEGYRYAPDLVVSSRVGPKLNIRNGCPERELCRVVDDAGRLSSEIPTTFDRLKMIVKKSGLVFYTYNFYIETMARSQADVARDFGWDPEDLPSHASSESAAAANSFDYHAKEVREILGSDVRLVFVVIPASFEVDPADFARWSDQLSTDPRTIDHQTRETLAELRARNLNVSHAIDSLRKEGESERLYFLLDSHLTAAGHKVVADDATFMIQAIIDQGEQSNQNAQHAR